MTIPCIKMENCLLVTVKKPIGYLAEKGCMADEIEKVEVLANKQSELHNGEIGLFELNGETLMKKYISINNKVTLLEPNEKPIEITQKDSFNILGKALEYHLLLA